ncbi:MAG TPA: head GIN domain-containing protein [Flavobacterium sp.]|nr:head GIN domain-containing protein [Flavobacterium sp.]
MKIKIFILSLFSILLIGCQKFEQFKPNGKTITKTIKQNPIFVIHNNSLVDIEFTNAIPKNTVLIEGNQNAVDMLGVSFDNGAIKFDTKKNNTILGNHIKIQIHAPDIKKLTLSGAGNVTENNHPFHEDLSVDVTGVGDVSISVKNIETIIRVSGAGGVNVKGQTNLLTLTMSGVGNVEAKGLRATNAKVSVSGVGNAVLNVKENLNIGLSGTGNVEYKSYPNLALKSNISGIGKVSAY